MKSILKFWRSEGRRLSEALDGIRLLPTTLAKRAASFLLPPYSLLLLSLYFALALSAPAQWLLSSATDLDANGDGMIRIALISRPQHSEIEAATVCADLESAIKASKTRKPVRVTFEPLTKNRTLLGWWYNPDTSEAREQLLDGNYDYVLLAESEEIIRAYPELSFEGARAVSEAFRARGATPALLMMAKPLTSFRDKRLSSLADITWRVADGCGLPVIPAALSWLDALTKNRIPGDHPQRARANAFIAAQTAYCGLANDRAPKGVLTDTDWMPRKTLEALAESARETAQQSKTRRYYIGPFIGTVRMENRCVRRLGVFLPSTIEDDPIRANFQYICAAASQDYFIKTINDWYTEGFDRATAPIDLTFGDTGQMTKFLDPESFTSTAVPTNTLRRACAAVFCRTPEAEATPDVRLRNIEKTLIEGYDYAHANRIAFIPYQAAWARAWQANPALAGDGKPSDWLTYMLANMIYTTATGRCQPVPEKDRPRAASPDHPYGYHAQAARIGYETIRQLSTLSTASNALLLRTAAVRIERDAPGFAAIRLLAAPAADVTVHCALDVPGAGELSAATLTFTPATFDIEQTVRITATTNRATTFATLMANAVSADKAIDGSNDKRPLVFNYRETDDATLTVNGASCSPSAGYTATVAPSARPVDTLTVSVQQHGTVTEEIAFAPHQYQPRPIRLYPTARDYSNGTLQVSLRLSSADRRFNNRVITHTLRVSSDGHPVPALRIQTTPPGEAFDGPLFIAARAEAEPAPLVNGLTLFMGSKRLGHAPAALCAANAEHGPSTRLGPGGYALWAAATTTNGLTVASPPATFTVK